VAPQGEEIVFDLAGISRVMRTGGRLLGFQIPGLRSCCKRRWEDAWEAIEHSQEFLDHPEGWACRSEGLKIATGPWETDRLEFWGELSFGANLC